MNKTVKKVLGTVLVICMILSLGGVFASCNNTESTDTPKSYTYKSYTTALGNNWNPHSWETNADDSILSYISSPFCTMSILDSENGVYQWVYEMATSIEDVTKDHQDDLTKYNVSLQSGKTAETTEKGYVYEIKLNPDAKWENGVKITADDYIYSMQQLLDSKMKNYRSNLYWGGESAVAGGLAYYNSESPIYEAVVPAYGEDEDGDYSYDMDAGIAAGQLYINVNSDGMTLYPMSLSSLDSSYLSGKYADVIKELADSANAYGYTKITADNKDKAYDLVKGILADLFGLEGESADIYMMEAFFKNEGKVGEKVDYDATVGCYKVDDYTIRYVTQNYIEKDYFLTSCTSTWLVYKDLYEANKDYTGELVTTKYGTSKDTTMSYGTYKIESLQDDKQIVFVQNENWYGFEKKDNGELISYTNFEVDGKKVQQYITTKIIIDVMEDAAAKQAFLKGDLTEWGPDGDDLVTYATSDYLYKVDETYTMSFFFNCNLDALKKMDESKGNTNSVVLSNDDFRKAMSLCIDRAKFVTATAGYKPAYSIMNSLYFYNVYEDPTSSYRNSDEAMQAICNLYGVKYGEGEIYSTLKEAYQSINGFNLTEAKNLMKQACDKLVADGVYTAGSDIKVRIGWAKGTLQSSDQKLVSMLNDFVNAALEGSGFGKITFEAIDNINNRYADVAAGEFAIGYGAWGGAAFYPFRNFQVYMDPDNYSIHEAGCWDPTTVEWTLNVNGEDVTMTCQDWSNCLIGNGAYSEAGFDVKLSITAQLEKKFLETYYRIPLCTSTSCFMMSKQVSYYTEDYNIMYDFGGLRLMKYNYDDEAWEQYKSSNELKYE